MKQITIYIILTLLTGTNAWSNETGNDQKSTYSISPFVGSTAYTVSGSDAQNTSKGGILAGIALQKNIDAHWEISTGLSYFENVSTFNELSFDPIDLEVKNLGLLFRGKYYFNKQTSEVFNMYILGSLTPSYILKAETKQDSLSANIIDDMNKFGFFADAGVGTDINFDGGKVTLDLSYSRGLTQFSKSSSGNFSGWQLSAGYSISL